jgi:hypothetical protein
MKQQGQLQSCGLFDVKLWVLCYIYAWSLARNTVMQAPEFNVETSTTAQRRRALSSAPLNHGSVFRDVKYLDVLLPCTTLLSRQIWSVPPSTRVLFDCFLSCVHLTSRISFVLPCTPDKDHVYIMRTLLRATHGLRTTTMAMTKRGLNRSFDSRRRDMSRAGYACGLVSIFGPEGAVIVKYGLVH